MRILQFSWEYPPLLYGGLGRHVHGLAEAQAAAGHEVVVVSQRHPDAPDDTVVGGVRVIRTEPGPGAPSMSEDIVGWVAELNGAMSTTAETLGTWRPDVVHAHDWLVALASLDRARADGVPLTTTIHATAHGTYDGDIALPRRRGRHDVEARLVDASDRLIVCSEAMREELTTAFGVETGRAEVIPNGVNPAIWRSTAGERAQVRAQLGIGADTPLFVLPARLKAFKGGDVAIDALAEVRRDHPDALLVLAGEGDHGAALRDHAERVGLTDAVRFAGHLGDRELSPLLGAATQVWVPSTYEPFGMTTLEGAAAGSPVVAADKGGLRGIIRHGETGLLVRAGSPEALAAAAKQLIGDPALADQLAAAAYRQVTTEYTWAQVATATTNQYDVARSAGPAAVASDTAAVPRIRPGGDTAQRNLAGAVSHLRAADERAEQVWAQFAATLDARVAELTEHTQRTPELRSLASSLGARAALVQRSSDSARAEISAALRAAIEDVTRSQPARRSA